MNAHLELDVIYADDNLKVEKVQWQWRGKFQKNGTADTLTKAHMDATDAYIEAHK